MSLILAYQIWFTVVIFYLILQGLLALADYFIFKEGSAKTADSKNNLGG